METLYVIMYLSSMALGASRTKTSCKALPQKHTNIQTDHGNFVLDCTVTKIIMIGNSADHYENHDHFSVQVKEAEDGQSSLYQTCRNPSCDSLEAITTTTPTTMVFLHKNLTRKSNVFRCICFSHYYFL